MNLVMKEITVLQKSILERNKREVGPPDIEQYEAGSIRNPVKAYEDSSSSSPDTSLQDESGYQSDSSQHEVSFFLFTIYL